MLEMEKEREEKEERRARRKERTVWTRGWILRRPQFGTYDHLLAELNREDKHTYRNHMGFVADLFGELLCRIVPRIQKKDTGYRKALPAGLKLAVTLHYLASGNTYTDMQYQLRMPHNTISRVVPEVCNALISSTLIAELQNEVMPKPGRDDYWRDIAFQFLDR